MTDRIQFLIDEIARHDRLYWVDNNPEISDVEYDALLNELKELDEDAWNEAIRRSHSIAGDNSNIVEMLSLKKGYTYDEIMTWLSGVVRSDDEIILVEPKLDGLSVDLTPGKLLTKKEDKSFILPLVTVYTDGKHFEEPGHMTVRGEMVVTKQNFSQYKDVIKRKGGEPYKTERNMAAGLINRDDLDVGSTPKILTLVDFNFISQKMTFGELKAIGTSGFDRIIDAMKSLDFPTDGVVFKIADEKYFKHLGVSSDAPKGAMALKYVNPYGYSELKTIIWSAGKQSITPIGVVDPINVSNVTITHVNLHNMKNIKDLGIHIGDTLKVERAGDVIPHCGGVKPGETRIGINLTACPACGSNVEYRKPIMVCVNPNCSGKHMTKLVDAVRRIGIENLGEPTLVKMVEVLNVRDLVDLFNLTIDDLLRLEGFADTKAANVFNDIQAVVRKGVFEWQILASLNLDGIGRSLSKILLADRTLASLYEFKPVDFTAFEKIGPERAEILFHGLIANKDYISRLYKILPIVLDAPVKVSVNDIRVCFSGKFLEKKQYYYDLLTEHGGYVIQTGVKKDTNILVVADPSKESNKIKAARKKGIQIIGVDELISSL